MDHLRQAQDVDYDNPQRILDRFDDILTELQAKLPYLFERLPLAGLEVRAIEGYREQAAPAAYYC